MVRVRFAPSPTGYLHIGGARTCLFNWLYARAKKGKFILRIEDTDSKRSEKRYLDEILESLSWLGLKWDEIYFQSQRFQIYKEFAQKLLKEGKAYSEKSPDDSEAIIFKIHPQTVKINDLIRGEIEFDSATIKDQVLVKSDSTPTYNFACVVDDAAMGITHVIRGDDHISNTPKQVLMYKALDFPLPEFAHLPLILGAEGGRLSKRTGATAVSDYRKMGYLPEALVNFLLLLGWAPGDNRELIDIEDAVKLFDIKNINKTAAVFNAKKLDWISSEYIKRQDPGKLTDLIIPMLIAKGHIKVNSFDRNRILDLVRLFQARISKLEDFVEWSDFFFVKEITIDPDALEKLTGEDLSREFALFVERLDALEKSNKFEVSGIEAMFRDMVKELNVESRRLIHPIRAAITGKTIGPGLFEVIYFLGSDKVKERLARWIKKV